MKALITTLAIAILGMSSTFAQISNNDPQVSTNNYKHANKAKEAANTDTREKLIDQEVSLKSQLTNKSVKRNYVLSPSNNSAASNVQGKKTKANYKNQF